MSNDLEELSFEQAVGELEATVERLEGGDLPLTEAIALYQRGVRLAQRCNQLLDTAELQVQELSQPDSAPET